MRLLAGFALVLITIAFVQSKPISSQVKNLDAGIASLPSLQVNHFPLSIFIRNYCISFIELEKPTRGSSYPTFW
jgi:hypothetical protein